MADEGGIFEGVDWSKYDPRNWTLDDVAGTATELGLTAVAPFLTTLLSPSEATSSTSPFGEDAWAETMHAVPGFLELSGEEQNRAIAERHSVPSVSKELLRAASTGPQTTKPVKRPVSTEKPFISVSRTGDPRSQATPMPTREDIISRLLASGRGPNITQGGGSPQTRTPSRISRTASPPSQATSPPTAEAVKRRLLAPKRGEYPPRTATQTVPFPINKRRAATLKREQQSMPKIVTEDIAALAKKLREKEKARGTQKAVSTMLEDRQTAPSGKDIRSGEKAEKKRKIAAAKKKRYQPSTASETAATKKTRKAVGTLLKDRQTAPDEVVIESARKAEAKRKAAKEKARKISLGKSAKKIGEEFRQPKVTPISKPKPKVVSEKKITKVKPKVAVKKVVKKKTTPIEADLGTGRKAHTVKSGQTLSGIAKQHGTTLKALLAANPKLKGRPNLIKVGEKIKIRGPLKKAASPYKGMTKKEWEKITTASKKQREQRSARKTGGGVGLHTAEMRSAGKDLHQPQSKIKKRIHEEITYAKKGGKVGKKKQGYKARKDESIAMRVKKKRTKKQLKASRNESYGKWGKGKGKGKINRFGDSLVASTYD